MGKSCRHSIRTSGSRRPDKGKEFRFLYEDPIIIPHNQEPVEKFPLPQDNNDWSGFVLIGGSILVLLGLWWLAPEWLGAIWRQILSLVGQYLTV
jgi:hypothetical protein